MIKYKMQGRRNLCYELLMNEIKNYCHCCSIRFVWKISRWVCKIQKKKDNALEIRINLFSIRKDYFHIAYVAGFLAQYILIYNEIDDILPASYFEELAFLYCACDREEKKCIYLFDPLLQVIKGNNKKFRLSPLEIYCGICSLENVKTIMSQQLSVKEFEFIEQKLEGWHAFSRLPEVAYSGSDIPVHALFDVLKKQEDRLNVKDKKWSTDIALRVMVYSGESISDSSLDLEEMVNLFIQESMGFWQRYQSTEEKLLVDNMISVMKMMERINSVIEKYDLELKSGSIHFIK